MKFLLAYFYFCHNLQLVLRLSCNSIKNFMIKNKASFLFLVPFLTLATFSYSQEKVVSLQDTTLARYYYVKGDSLSNIAQYDSSNFYLEKGKEIYNASSKQYNQKNLLEGLILCYNDIGWNLMMQAKFDSAMQQLSVALETGIKKFGENNFIVAQTYNIIGAVYWSKDDYDKALNYYQKSLSICLLLFDEGNPHVASSYNNIGILYWEKGDYDRALEYLQKSLAIRIKILGEENSETEASYMNIGLVYKEKGDYDKALQYYQKSLSVRTSSNEDPQVADCYNDIGIIYSNEKNYNQALEYYEKSVQIRIKLFGENHQDIAQSYLNIGLTYLRMGDYSKALEMYRKSLPILLQLFGENHSYVAENYMYIGNVYRYKGDYNQALEYLQKSLTIRKNLFGAKHPSIGENYLDIAEVYEKKNNPDTALSYSQRSIISLIPGFDDESIFSNPSLDDASSEVNLLDALKLKANIFSEIAEQTDSDDSDLKMALSTYDLAVKLIDKMRTGYKTEGSKLFLGEKVTEVYERAIQTSLRLYALTNEDQYKQQAFLFSEKSKAAVLQEGLNEAHAIHFAKLPSGLLEEEKQLKVDLAFYNTQLQKDLQDSV